MRMLYDLAAADPDQRFSPYCWRIKLALAHKRLPFDTTPVRFTDKALLAFSGQDKVPVLRDGDTVVSDSAAIASYLEKTYPDRPLWDGAMAEALTTFMRQWTERVLHPALVPLLLLDIHARLAPADAAYFRKSREERLGGTLESVCAGAATHRATLAAALTPLRATLARQPFVCGASPAFADYLVFGAMQWARTTCPRDLLADDETLFAWRERMLDLYDGLGRSMPAAGA